MSRYKVIFNRRHYTYGLLDKQTGNTLIVGMTKPDAEKEKKKYDEWRASQSAAPVITAAANVEGNREQSPKKENA